MCPVEHQTWTKGFQALTPDFRLPWNLLLILCLFHFLFLFLPRRKLHVELEPAFQPADLAALQTYCRNHSRSGGCRAHLAVGGCGLLPCAHRWELNSWFAESVAGHGWRPPRQDSTLHAPRSRPERERGWGLRLLLLHSHHEDEGHARSSGLMKKLASMSSRIWPALILD